MALSVSVASLETFRNESDRGRDYLLLPFIYLGFTLFYVLSSVVGRIDA